MTVYSLSLYMYVSNYTYSDGEFYPHYPLLTKDTNLYNVYLFG